jgi:hypothetical protein
MSFYNYIFVGPKDEIPFSIIELLNPLLFVQIVKVLKLTTFSNRGDFDHSTL